MGDDTPAGILYIVATPIGNLDDITLRALEVLRSVAAIACEDTRHTKVLLTHHGIEAALLPFHKFNENRASASIVRRLRSGESLALVSDGGTPAISDPGYRLVRDALDAGVRVTPIPGPSAFVAAVSASGLPSECVTFRGFLPHRGAERRREIEALRDDTATQVFYESPHRIEACLSDLAELLGERPAAVARELTKRFETWHRGTLSEVAQAVADGTVKGEFCVVVEGARRERAGKVRTATGRPAARAASDETKVGAEAGADSQGEALGPADLRARYEAALAAGLDRKDALRTAADECGVSRKDAYRVIHGGS